MSEKSGTITLIAKEITLEDNRKTEALIAMFKPPVPPSEVSQQEGSGHPVLRVMNDDRGNIRGMVYERGIFGWTDNEREADFLKFYQTRAEARGYAPPSEVVHHAGETAIVAEVSATK